MFWDIFSIFHIWVPKPSISIRDMIITARIHRCISTMIAIESWCDDKLFVSRPNLSCSSILWWPYSHSSQRIVRVSTGGLAPFWNNPLYFLRDMWGYGCMESASEKTFPGALCIVFQVSVVLLGSDKLELPFHCYAAGRPLFERVRCLLTLV